MTEPSGRRRQGPARDYTAIGEVSDPAFVRLPDAATVFAARSARQAAVAAGNPMAPFLHYVSRLTQLQHLALEAMPRPTQRPDPPLSKAALADDTGFATTLERFLLLAEISGAPEAAAQARSRLLATGWPERLMLAEEIFDGAYPAHQLGECLFVAAALQVHLTYLAAQLDASALRPLGDGLCPSCGRAPVSSVVVGWADAGRARYLCCSLCATLWNYVRIKCSACGSTAGISYYQIEQQSNDIAVETCTECRTYIKHLHQHRTKELDPFADDLASFGLDLLVQRQGFRRATANPFLVFAG